MISRKRCSLNKLTVLNNAHSGTLPDGRFWGQHILGQDGRKEAKLGLTTKGWTAMPTIKLSDQLLTLLRQKNLTTKELLLIADDGGGKYSLRGGACSIGTTFTLIVLDTADPDYDEPLVNAQDLHMWTSAYDSYFFSAGLVLDVVNHQIMLKDNAHILDSAVQIANGATVLAAFKTGTKAKGEGC